jgi:hypothetical protein
MFFIRLKPKDARALELELVPREARRELTRLIRRACRADDGDISLMRENEFINMANQVLGRPNYVLEADREGTFEVSEHAWHRGERELIMRLPSTSQLAEILADYLEQGMLATKAVNEVLSHHGCGFSFAESEDRYDQRHISLEVSPLDALPEADIDSEHPNIRKLADRMDRALAEKDPAAVLHAAASIFETLAKDVVQNPSVADQTLASFFDGYRKKSLLPEPVLDYMLQVYKNRNKQPLAGHGSLIAPNVSQKDAIVITEMTKAILRIERSLAQEKLAANQP